MQIEVLFDRVPLHFLFVGMVVLVFCSITAGFSVGSYVRRRREGGVGTSAGAIIGAMLGLLAFILAFTFGLAASRYDARKQMLLEEINAIGTAFLRTAFLGEPEGSEARELLRRYVDIRVAAARDVSTLPQGLVESENIHGKLWSQVTAVTGHEHSPVMLGLYVQSLNQVIDVHTQRVVVGLQYRVPGSVWLVLSIVAMLTMWAVGYDFGLNNAGNLMISVVLALAFASVMLLIADLDLSSHGLIKLDHTPLFELQERLRSSAPD